MDLAVLLVGDNGAEVDVFHAAEDVLLHLRIDLFQLSDEVLDLKTLRFGLSVLVAGGAVFGELAGTLYEVEVIVVPPVLYISLADKIQRTYQLHALEVGAVELRHHGLHLTAVEHTHKYGLDNVIEVVTESDLVAAELLCLAVKVAAAHTRADVAGILLDIVDRVKISESNISIGIDIDSAFFSIIRRFSGL